MHAAASSFFDTSTDEDGVNNSLEKLYEGMGP